jgi:hypothetical protein
VASDWVKKKEGPINVWPFQKKSASGLRTGQEVKGAHVWVFFLSASDFGPGEKVEEPLST